MLDYSRYTLPTLHNYDSSMLVVFIYKQVLLMIWMFSWAKTSSCCQIVFDNFHLQIVKCSNSDCIKMKYQSILQAEILDFKQIFLCKFNSIDICKGQSWLQTVYNNSFVEVPRSTEQQSSRKIIRKCRSIALHELKIVSN